MAFFNSFDGNQIYYEVYDNHKPFSLIFLHGWTSESGAYKFLLPLLKEFNVIFWDARSHGKSGIDHEGTVTKMAADFKYFLEHVYSLKVPVIGVGHSMGALTLMEYNQNYGSLHLNKMVFVDQSPKLMCSDDWPLGIYGNYTPEINNEMVGYFLKDLGEGVIKLGTRGLNKSFNKMFEKKPEFFYDRKRIFKREGQTEALVAIWQTLVAADYRETVKKIDIPVLLLYGKKSQYYLQATGEYMNENIQESKLIYLKRGDHSPFIQHPEEFCQAITDYSFSEDEEEILCPREF